MNKVFKVIWSEARNAYVVVSEMAKSHGTKSCSTKKLLAMLIATGVMTCASVAPVMAANLAPEDYQIEAGNGASASGQGSVAIGNNAQASGLVGIAIGRDAEAIGSDSIAIGGKTKANQIYSVAIGNDISYIGYSSTAVGQQAYATGDVSTAIGTMTNVDADYNATHDDWRKAGYQSTAIGAYSGSWGIASTALGGYSRADEKFATAVGYGSHATAERATTLGAKAEANAYESVAIGAFSVADRESGAVGAFAPEGADSLTWKANRGAVSVGSSVEGEEITRQITNVAAGSEATDAVNVAQLKAATENAGWNLATNGVATEATKVKPGDYVDFSGDKNISVSHDGTKVQVKLNENIDVNSIKTNALNSKYNLSVGTMAENGIMPFLVSSTGAFYAANNNFSVDKDGKVIATAGEIGNVVLQNGVYTGNSALRDGELYVGDASGNYSQITTTGAKLGQVTIAADGKISGVAAGEVSKTSTDAINGSQLNQTNENVAALDKRVTQNEADIAQNKADIAQNKADIAQNKADIAQNKADIAQNKADIAQNKADIATNKADIATNKADIATNKANIAQNAADIKKVEALAKKHTTVAAGDNITVSDVGPNAEGGKEYEVKLADNITVNSVTANTFKADQTVMDKDGLKVGDKVSVTATAVTAGKTSISDEGVKVGDKTYISADGLNANGQHITNVKAGEADTDAVNYGQLKDTNNRINQLGSRVNKVGAGAAALAALHPMDFDPDDKLTFSAGYGNYGGENAAAIGAYYRPDEKVMFSVAGTVGNGENMVNAGVSFALDRTNHVSNSRTALAREVIDLRGQLAVMGAKMAKMEKAFGMLDETKTKLFPDVPANHWAYEYIAKLAGNGYIEGYPDGNFGGDRLMTRYEFAAMLYRAIEKGAALEEKIIKEFEPELGRIRVDRISGEDGDRDKIERVRVNDTKGERDHYGNKLAK